MGLEIYPKNLRTTPAYQVPDMKSDFDSCSVFSLNNLAKNKEKLAVITGGFAIGVIGLSCLLKRNLLSTDLTKSSFFTNIAESAMPKLEGKTKLLKIKGQKLPVREVFSSEEEKIYKINSYLQAYTNKSKIKFEPVKTFEEYTTTLDKIKKYKSKKGDLLFDFQFNARSYPNVTKEEEGLLLYCGANDLSDDINRFLSGRPMLEMKEECAEDVIKVLEYSLSKLDTKYGKYNGIAFRRGFFVPDSGQYISATTDMKTALSFYGTASLHKEDFYIIETKSGHKINEFQKSMDSSFISEKEILIPKNTHLEENIKPNENLIQLKNEFIKLLNKKARSPINSLRVHILREV